MVKKWGLESKNLYHKDLYTPITLVILTVYIFFRTHFGQYKKRKSAHRFDSFKYQDTLDEAVTYIKIYVY
jgi:hypothetical protein|tara:strand:+ start:2370 stop:2579 length:210 start_codon:yes stop_codon:yes gene_type:complete